MSAMAGGGGGVQGVGLGLRYALVDEILSRTPAELPALRWLECHPENYMRRGGAFPAVLERARERYPFATHGLCMSLGGVDPLSETYLRTLREFLRTIEAPWHSDHLCFSVAHGVATHDLLPVPMNDDTVMHFARRIRQAQDRIGVRLAVENVSAYVIPEGTTLDEATFVRAVCEEADCALMLDVNNVWVNAQNFGLDARAILAAMPLERVVQMHVAGHWFEEPDFIIDTHSEPICEGVYDLLAFALSRTGQVPVLLERDDEFPPFAELYAELERLDAIFRAAPARGLVAAGRLAESA